MFATGTLNDSTILRLRVKGSDLDPLALRGRLQSVLSDVSLQPRLPPSAILFIRKINDPLPGSIQLDSPHARAPLAWRQAFQTRFDQLVASAARPAHGFVADSAESVVFYDYAELLASLTADWCGGVVMSRWWWKALIQRGDVSQMIRRLWREKVEYVPAALEFLVRKEMVVEFVSRLSEVEVCEILESVVHAFGVTRIARIKATDFSTLVMAPEERSVVAAARCEMPWRDVAPESDTPRLLPVQQLFVGIVLMVQRAPARARTVSFARAVEQWLVQEQLIREAPDTPEIVIPEIKQTKSIQAPKTEAPIRENPIYTNPVALKPDPPPEASTSSVVKKPEPIKLANAIFHYESPDTAPIDEPAPVIQSDPTIESTSQPEPIIPVFEILADVTIETELGGLFYLINLALFLEIYSDFTSPVERFHDDLSIWDFVTIVGKEIDQEHNDDVIWEWLRNFAGRDGEDALITPAWLADLLPHIHARLHLALGIDDDLAQILLYHHARVTITPTHLDVFFSLADHPIEIRLSGLDRNPGWVPAAGRFIAFHYD
jgi:hypothetical protein